MMTNQSVVIRVPPPPLKHAAILQDAAAILQKAATNINVIKNKENVKIQ